jgi:hypothetical protein
VLHSDIQTLLNVIPIFFRTESTVQFPCVKWDISLYIYSRQTVNEEIDELFKYCFQRYCFNSKLRYKYYVSGHYPSSCIYLKHRPIYISKQRFEDWILSPSSGKTYSHLGPNDRPTPYLLTGPEYVLPEDGDKIQSPKRCVFKYKQGGVFR